MISEDRKKLYDALSSEYDLGTYEEFERNIGDSVKRRKLYDAASADYDLGDFESYSQRIGPTHKESLDAFTAEYGSWLDDFEARDSAETNMSKAGMSSGIYVPAEGAITGEERKRYMELHKQEEALKKAWFTSDEYLAQKDADALFLSDARKGLSEQMMEYAQANPVLRQEGPFQINPYATRGAEADTELEKYKTASRILDDAIKMHNAPSKYDGANVWQNIGKFGKGAADTLSDVDFWSMGLTEIADNLGVRDVLSTVQEKLGNLNDLSEESIENILSPAEKAVLQAWAINTQEQLKRKDDLSRGYQAGKGAAESLGFMAEFALTGGIGKAATEGVEQMAKWLGKKALTKVGGMTDDVAAKVLKETGEKVAQSTVGKYGVGLAESLAEAAGRTGVMPSTFRNISEKAAEIETDENGNNYLVKMNDAFAKGYVDSFIENLSEGGRINALGALFGDVAGKIPAYKKMVDKFSHTKASELWDAFNSSGVMNTLRAGGWHGLGEEYLEEWYGNALRTLTGVDKEALKDFATVDNQIVTLTSFLPMTIFGGTVSTAQVLSANKDLEKKAAALKSALMERGYDEAQANNMIDMMRGAAPAEVSETLTPIVNSVANRNTNEAAALMKPVGEFAAAVQRWQSFNTKYNYQEQEQRDGLRTQMEENLGQFWQQDENGRQTVQRGVNEKGEVVYMLGKPSVEDVEAGVTSEVAAVTSDGRKVFVNPSEYQLEDELEMNTFLGNEIMAEKGNQEQARMIEEKEAKIAAIRETAVPGTAVNIGTAEAPMQAIVIQRNPDGVIVNTPDGQTRQMTYEEFGNYVGVNAVPMTDAQIDEHEANVLTADRAQREAALDQEYDNDDAALEELSEAEDEIEQAVDTNTPLPMKADGSVDQTALWNNDPERWAQWNDEQRQDGGANSLAYVSGAIAKEQAKIAELQAAYAAESDFDARDAIEKEIADTQARVGRLTAIQQGYVAQAEAAAAPVVEAEPVAPRISSQVGEQVDEQYDGILRQTRIKEERVRILQEYLDKISEGSLQAFVLTSDNYADVMRREGCSEGVIAVVGMHLEAGENIGGFTSGGKLFLMEDGLPSIEEARITYIHERQHVFNTKNPAFVKAVASIADKQMLLSWLSTFVGPRGLNPYKSLSAEQLADEVVARCMEIAYTTKEFSVDLQSRGIPSEIISIITDIDNEQRKDQNLLNSRRGTRRDTSADVSGTGSLREDGRNIEQVSGGVLEQETTRPSIISEERVGSRSTGEGAEVISEEQLNAPNSGTAQQITAADGEVLADTDGKVGRLTAIQQGYVAQAEAAAAPVVEAEPVAPRVVSQMSEQEKAAMDAQHQARLDAARSTTAKREAMQNYINEISQGSVPMTLISMDEYEQVMKDAGCTPNQIDQVKRALKVAKLMRMNVPAFFVPRVGIFAFVENIPNIEQLRLTYVHERQHQFTAADNKHLNALLQLGLSRERLAEIVYKLSTSEFYSDKDVYTLADEIISYAMERAYTYEDFSVALQELGIEQEIIDIITEIDNEQRNEDSTYSSRRRGRTNLHDNSSRSQNGAENDRNSETVSGGLLDEQGDRSSGDSVRGNLGGGQGSTGEGAEVISEEQLNAPNSGTAQQITAADGEVLADTNGKGGVRFSIRTWNEGGRDYLASWLANDTTLTEEEKADILARMDEFYKNALLYSDTYAPFGTWSDAGVRYDNNGNPLMSVIKANGDYAMNLDFSLVCKKRRPLNRLLRTLVNRNAFATYTLRERELAEINWILQEHGFEVACALCFVDSKRYRVTGVADVFSKLYNILVKALAPKGVKISHFNYNNNPNVEVVENGLDTLPEDQLNWAEFDRLVSSLKPNSVEYKMARYLREHPEARKLVDATDFIEAEGFESVKENNPDLLKFYNMKKGTGGPKASFGDVQYLNDILKKEKSFDAEKAYAVGGVRLQSFSDFVPHMYFDYMQLFAELAAKKLPLHAYTKEVLFAKIFGLTGAKINMSLVPAVVEGGIAPGLDAEGNYAWADPVTDTEGNVIQQGQSFPYDEAMAIQKAEGYSKNCGIIAVGISDAHIEKMLDDPNIPFIIPYHKSSLNAIVARMTNIDQYKDYTNVQNTRKASGSKLDKGTKDFNFNEYLHGLGESGTPQQAAQAYLDWCRENNYKPKFSQFAYHPNYYKLLQDFNTIDLATGEYAPQGAVTMTFPTEENAFGNVETLIQQGLQEDAELEEKMEQEIDGIADQVLARLEEISKEPKMSEKQQAKKMAELADERIAKIRERAEQPIDVIEEARRINAMNENADVAFRFIGEMGAIMIDHANEAHMMMDLLEVAREMAQDGRSEREIKLATGWERGADGKWRYEEPDFTFKTKPGRKKTFKLSELIEDETLFEAYPEFKDIQVKFTKLAKGKNGEHKIVNGKSIINLSENLFRTPNPLFIDTLGAFQKNHPEIYNLIDSGRINKITPEQWDIFNMEVGIVLNNQPEYIDEFGARETLAHEIQHAIQRVEGFARGGAASMIDTTDPQVREERNALKSALNVETDHLNYLAQKYHDTRNKAIEANNSGNKTEGMRLILESDKIAKEWLSQKTLVGSIERDLKKLKRLGDEGYKKLAGEVEARNVMSRLNMSFDERRQSLYSDTQDVATEEQIFLRKNIMQNYHEMMSPSVSFRITPEMDADYLAAVERGDMETAQRMVNEAAKIAMPNTQMVDEDGNPMVMIHNTASGDFTIFDPSRSISPNGAMWFANEKGQELVGGFDRGERDVRAFLNITNPNREGMDAAGYALEEGYDGVIVEQDGAAVAVVYNPSQIKSADPVTYDDSGNVIPLSERFNPDNEDIRFRVANDNQAIFVSNAAKAVEGIKQEKATPEQWLKMIEKNGGLKAGEDKWMGLSDWLKASDKKTLTKQEVLDFVNENMIVIEEQHYSNKGVRAEADRILNERYPGWEDAFSFDWDPFMEEPHSDIYDEVKAARLYNETHEDQVETDEDGDIINDADYDKVEEFGAELAGIWYGRGKENTVREINGIREDYTTAGLENNHEIALTVPTIKPWNIHDETHFGDAGGGRAVAWIRFGDTQITEEGSLMEYEPKSDVEREIKNYIEYAMRNGDDFETSVGYAYNQITDAPQESVGWTEEAVTAVADGMRGKEKVRKVLVIDEVQSKRHQEGREKGYIDQARLDEIERRKAEIDRQLKTIAPAVLAGDRAAKRHENLLYKEIGELRSEGYALTKDRVPDAPFDKNWHELAMKRMLRYAAENGYDVVAWTTGDQQADRYDLSRDVKKISASKPTKDGERIVNIYYRDEYNDFKNLVVDKEGKVVQGDYSGNALADVIGKEMALQIMKAEESTEFKGDGLKIGGEGMRGFYDKMLPAFMNKYGKKWGVKVEDIDLPNLGKSGRTMHSIPVTEEMKASVMEGQVMFRTIPITQEVQDEMDAISATAIVRGNYLKAPNGADTNLTPEQWAMVRTKNFKNWFGDWENDPENASKVVDENGEPKVVYHQTNAVVYINRETGENWDELDWRARQEWDERDDWEDYWEEQDFNTFSRANARTTNEFDGFFFAPEYDEYHEYGDRTIAAFVNIKNPASREDYHIDSRYNDAGRNERIRLQEAGFDGVIRMDGDNVDEYIAFEPNQIKSATDNTGEFSTEDKDIRYRVMSDVNTNPTEAQKKAGNYKMGHIRLDGYNITIENPKGSVRRGTDSKGNAWENTLNNDYGYIRGTEGVDGDHIDVYLSDNPTEGNVFVIDQVNPETREFDEHKVMYGFNSAEEAREAYLANFSEGWNGLGTITEVSKDEFKKWIESSHRKTKPFSEYKSVKTIEVQSEGEDMEDNLLPSAGTPTDEVVANGLQLTPAQTAEVAANIFAALPEESRKKITEGLNGNVLGLKDAIMQIPTSLASKENWNDEDKQMADVVAEEMTKVAGEMTRPFSAEEGLWLLYNNLNKGTDLVSQASRALVQRNLGFDAETLAKQEQAKEDVRFRTVGDATSNAQASLYNRGAVNVWTRLKELFVDMQASVEELVKAIEKRTGKEAQGFENILLALNQQSSKGLAAMESYTQKFLNPMFDEIRRIMDETKMKYEDVVRYVILKHGLERNKKLAQRDARAHYQEIYDDIISKITGMTAAQKRTYLTNAQLKESDAKAELATLQAVDMTAMTDEEKREHKKKLAAARKAVEEAEEHLKRAQKIASMSEQEAQDELDKIFEKIENGTDSVFKEMRENDYSGISSMFYDQLGVDRKNFSTEEQYQAALMEAKKDRYSSLKDIEAAAEAEVKSFEGKTDTKELWKRINAATKETLRQQYEANMISKDQYLNLRDMFEYYVPLRGFKDNTAEDMYTYYRKPNSTGYTKPILGAEGRKTEAESPFGWIAAMAGSAIASNVKNEAKLALFYFVSNRPENGIATISKTWFVDSGEVDERGKKIFKPAYPPFSEDLSSAEGKAQYEIWQANMKELQKKGQAYEAGQRLNLGNAVVNISDANKPEHIVNVKVGGKDYTIIINGNPRAAQAINGDLNIEGTAQDYSALFGPVLRWMSSVNTSYNPEFWITNMMRDMAFTMMAVNIKEDPVYRRKFSKNYRKAFKVVSLVAKNEKGTIGDSYLEQQYKDFVKYGGVTGYTQIKDSETWEQEIENYLSSTDPESLKSGKVMRGMKSVFHAAHRFGESLEQVSRFAAFLTARETGKSINEAINDAKEITVNFNRKGSGKMITLEEAKYLTGKNGQPLTKPQQWMVVGLSSIAPLGRRFIMFFNAAIQGLNATYKLMKKNPKRFTGWALGYAAVGMMNAVLHAMLDDDDDYLDIPQYERRNSLMIGGNGAYFKWALPQEARAFYALGDLAVETVMGRNPHQNFLGEALKIGTEILPVNPSEGWKAFMPSVAIPFIELALNEDYKGAPIYNEQKWLSEEEKERTAKWSNAYQGTGWTYVKIAQGLNFITGGDKHDAGWINIQPEKLEHLVQSAFGGTIRTADKFINTISAALDPEEPMTIRQTPFLNRFLTINDERFKNVHVNDVFDYYKADAEHALTLEKQYIKDRDMDSLTELRSSDEYQWAKIYGKYKKPLKAIQDKIKVADGTAEKKELMKQQDELKKRMIKEISEL